MRTRTSPTCNSLIVTRLGPTIEEREALFKVEGGGHAFEGEPKLHHRQRHLGLNPDDDGLCAPELGGVGNATEGSRGKRVEHVERGDVDDHTARTMTAYQVGQVVAQLEQVTIAQRRLDAGDERVTLFENRNGHSSPRGV